LKKQSKAQSSVEFVILVTFMLMVFVTITIVIQSRTSEAQDIENMNYAEQLKDIVFNEITIAESMPYNYTKNFYLPRFIDGNNYTLEINEGAELVINFRSKEYVYLLNKNFNWGSAILIGDNFITKRKVLDSIVYGFNVDVRSPYPNAYYNGTHSWVLGSVLNQNCNDVCDTVEGYKCENGDWSDIDCDLIENYFGIQCSDCSDVSAALNPRYEVFGEEIICYSGDNNVNCVLSDPNSARLCVCMPS
jgi:hypothetical protein